MTQLVSVYLPTNIEYVTGTVNGAAAEWQYIDGKWQTVAARSGDDIYRVEITALTVSGVSASFQFTLYLGSRLITDRTQADFDRYVLLRERIIESGISALSPNEIAEWLAGMRGAYNASDLNRVEDAVLQLTAILDKLGYTAFINPHSVSWTMQMVPTEAEMRQYLDNVAAIRDSFHILQTTPPLPESMADLTFQGANAIEQLLTDVEYLIHNMIADFIYSDEIYSGEDDWV